MTKRKSDRPPVFTNHAGERVELLDETDPVFRNDCPDCAATPHVTAKRVIGQQAQSREPFCLPCAVKLDASGMIAVGSARRVRT